MKYWQGVENMAATLACKGIPSSCRSDVKGRISPPCVVVDCGHVLIYCMYYDVSAVKSDP